MKLVIQRVLSAEVLVDKKIYGEIQKGIVVFLGIAKNDSKKDVKYLIKKIINMRIFNDECGKMNLSIKDLNLSIMIISQFTLYADCEKGNRPSFLEAEVPQKAQILYDFFIEEIKKYNINFITGKFGAMMNIKLINDGPVTIILKS